VNLKLIGFIKTGHNVAEDSSATQASSQTSQATIMRTSEAGEYFGNIASFFESLKMCINEFKTNWFYKNRP